MSRPISVLVFLCTMCGLQLAQADPVSLGPSEPLQQPFDYVGWSQPSPPTTANSSIVDDMQAQLEQAQAEVAMLRQQLGSQSRMDTFAQQELEELRDATGFEMTDQEARQYNMEPDGRDTPGPGGDMGDMATQSQNPVGGLWMLWFQNDMQLLEGPGDGKRIFNTTVFQPVMPVQLNDTWKLINRPVFMVNTWEVPSPFNFNPGGSQDPLAGGINDPFDTEFGLGDTVLIQWLSKTPSDSKMTFGVGWNWMFPTATQNELGTGKTAVGPSAVAVYLGDQIITGAIVQQYYSIAGPDSRDRVSLMDVQYIFRYRLNPMFSIGMAPNMRWDQVTNKVTMPIAFGFDTMTMTKSKMPIRWGAELQYFASHESPTRQFDPEWNFRLYMSPIIQAPDWATRGLCGSSRKCRCGQRRCHH